MIKPPDEVLVLDLRPHRGLPVVPFPSFDPLRGTCLFEGNRDDLMKKNGERKKSTFDGVLAVSPDLESLFQILRHL